jgi:hypothetical protein
MRSLAFSFKKGTYLKMLFIPFSCINAVYSPALLLLQLKGASGAAASAAAHAKI